MWLFIYYHTSKVNILIIIEHIILGIADQRSNKYVRHRTQRTQITYLYKECTKAMFLEMASQEQLVYPQTVSRFHGSKAFFSAITSLDLPPVTPTILERNF